MRWRWLSAPFGRVLCISFAGAFFNLFLPGAAGGDIAKAVLSARGEERKAAIVGTILLDRVIGLA
ncbi:MAG: lysylphosphatidylglycerol synthase domain-containing protein, partial [Planctomycetota bacterium]